MKRYIDISQFINKETIQSISTKLVEKFILRRKEMGLSRRALSIQSDVSYGTIRRFEETGNISLQSLLKLAQAIDSLDDFALIFSMRKVKSLKDEWKK